MAARQMIHIKCQAVFTLYNTKKEKKKKKKEKKNQNVVCCSCDEHFKG